MKTIGYAAHSATEPLRPYHFDRRELRDHDIAMEIIYCGVCHSDLHTARSDWPGTRYPVVPGHEIIGRVIATGPAVTKFAVGDHAAVGCLVDSCCHCDQCDKGDEHRCRDKAVGTYGALDRVDGTVTQGGYSKHLVVTERFAMTLPAGLDLARAAPILCAGVTTWSPLKAYRVGPGTRVAVMGLGGLGHMAVKLAVGLGASVTVITRTADKTEDALALGAHNVLLSSDSDAMRKAADSFDVIIDTVPVKHDLKPYLPLLDIEGALVIVGQVGPMEGFVTYPLFRGRKITGSAIGGLRETQEVIDFCAEKGILPDVEMIRMDQINEAFARMEQADVRYRFVIDMASLQA